MHHIKISNFGPIKECEIDVNQFTVLTGPQASGKSTIAKAIYLFRTVKEDILDLILKNEKQKPLKSALLRHLGYKTGNLFDRSSIMTSLKSEFILKYNYGEDTFIYLDMGNQHYTFGSKIENFLDDKSNLVYPIDEKTKNKLSEELNNLFQDDTETIYIPAGRIAISLLSEQLNYIFMSMDDTQRKTIDYSVWKYFELVLKIKPWFEKMSFGNEDKFYEKIIKAKYKYENAQERLYFDDDNYAPLSYASSGQQEAVWILNILTYFSAIKKKVFLIVEEPEAHLYPESQMYMTDVIALFINAGNNAGLITTHSPYILGEFNNLILCGQAENEGIDKIYIKEASDINEQAWFKKDVLQAFHVIDGKCENALIDGLIMNELIEGASVQIDEKSAGLIELFHREDDK